MKKKILLILALVMLLSLGVKAEEVKTVNAVKSSQKVSVDGKAVEISAYNIAGSNYFKLRDVAVILSGTDKEFDTGYNEEQKRITLDLKKAYNQADAGVSTITKKEAKGIVKQDHHLVDGKQVYLETILIDGNNYVKLRDLGIIAGFTVDYDPVKNEILIITKDIDYVEEKELNNGDDIKKLGSIKLSSIKDLNSSLKEDYKLDIEEASDGIKFFSNINGKKERFYLCDYYCGGRNHFAYGEPNRVDTPDFDVYSNKCIRYIKDINKKLDESNRDNLKLKLPAYNYVYFVKTDDRHDETEINLNYIIRQLYGVSDKGYKLPLSFHYYNNIGAYANKLFDMNISDDYSGTFREMGLTIPLGKVNSYTVDKAGKKAVFNNGLLLNPKLNKDTDLFIMDYTINRVKGKILVYLVK